MLGHEVSTYGPAFLIFLKCFLDMRLIDELLTSLLPVGRALYIFKKKTRLVKITKLDFFIVYFKMHSKLILI